MARVSRHTSVQGDGGYSRESVGIGGRTGDTRALGTRPGWKAHVASGCDTTSKTKVSIHCSLWPTNARVAFGISHDDARRPNARAKTVLPERLVDDTTTHTHVV